MKKLFSLSIIASSLLFNHQSRADENYYLNYDSDAYANPAYEILKSTVSGETNKIDLITTFDTSTYGAYLDTRSTWIDYSLNKIYASEVTRFNGISGRSTGNTWSYSIDNDSWSLETLLNSSADSTPHLYHIGNNSHTATSTNASNISSNDTDIATNASNISSNDTDIATNASNISSNTSNIKNLGQGVAGSTALTAALTALPQTSKDSKLSCGIGTGAYSSRYAVGFGCASKVNERVDVNAGGSYVFGGSKSYGGGTLDSGVIKAGFVFKLGELNKPIQISLTDKKVMETKILSLEENNNKIISQNKDLKR